MWPHRAPPAADALLRKGHVIFENESIKYNLTTGDLDAHIRTGQFKTCLALIPRKRCDSLLLHCRLSLASLANWIQFKTLIRMIMRVEKRERL